MLILSLNQSAYLFARGDTGRLKASLLSSVATDLLQLKSQSLQRVALNQNIASFDWLPKLLPSRRRVIRPKRRISSDRVVAQSGLLVYASQGRACPLPKAS